MVVLDPQLHLATDIIPCEDAYTQERALLSEIVPTVKPDDVWIADRNMCTRSFLMGIAQRQGFFVIREHENLPWQALGELKFVEQTPTGKVFEQPIQMEFEGKTLTFRRVVVQLDTPTRNDEEQVVILSNLPKSVGAIKIASLYLKRWSIETLFQTVTEVFHCEIKTLGYPKAALFSFTIALMSYNLFGVLAAALSSAHGGETVDESFSYYYAAEEVQAAYHGMCIALPDEEWRFLAQMELDEFCATLIQWASRVKLKFFTKTTRKPKKQKQKRKYDPKRPHVSTARVLNIDASA
ncbi:MAG: transposase [Moorea sp. SIO3C2]|nr:transposase [Moorena sp. SIO3C2]